MPRETKTITTPGGHSIVLRSYLTGREANQLKELLFADLKLNIEDVRDGKMAVEDIPASFLVKQEEKAIELLVVSVDGVTENAAQAVLDFPSADYDAVLKAINAIRNPTTPEK
jgi:hypothetical protein